MPSPIDFNVSPYYDDYSKTNNYHRILFRPAFAVQARELTQAQTIVQNQIEHFGDHVFKSGSSVIPGQLSIDTYYTAIKLTSKSASNINDYNSTTLTGGTSGVVAQCIGVSVADGTDPDTLFIKYDKTGTDKVSTVFTDTEIITSSADGNPTAVVASTHTGSATGIATGVYYINGYFVNIAASTLVLDKYTNTPSYRIGLSVAESFTSASDDVALNDNAAGSTNYNAPGAHRFKILLTLTKKILGATDDTNFIEIARVQNGQIKVHARNSQYAVLEETLARRTFDESGDYTVDEPDFDVRESVELGNNRGIYTDGATTSDGGTAATSMLAIGIAPFKSYVRGFEAERIGTTWLDVDKARDFDTQNNHKTRFDIKNFVYVDNVYGTPDVNFVSGDSEAFKTINLYDTATAVRGTEQSTSGNNTPGIGRAKSRGFELANGTESADIFAQTSTWKHYIFDVEMFTHLKISDNTTFTTGEIVSGSTSGTTGYVQAISSSTSATITAATQADPVVITATGHEIKDGDAVSIADIVGMTDLNGNTYYVKVVDADSFSLHDSVGNTIDGTGFGVYSSGGTASTGTVILSSVEGIFAASETITGQTSNNSAIIKADLYGNAGVQNKEFSQTKQIGMAGSPTYTADTSLSTSYGGSTQLSGNVSIANSDATLLGNGTKFISELRPGDSVTWLDDVNTTTTGLVQRVISNNEVELTANVGGSDVSVAAIATRQRSKLQNPEKNIGLFELPYKTVKTLKTTTNSNLTDTNFNVRRQFTGTLSSNGDLSITAGTNEIFASQDDGDFSVSVMSTGGGGTGAVGDTLNTRGSNHESDPIFALGGSPSGKSLTFDFGADFAGHKVKILATLARTVAGSKTKSANDDTTVNISDQSIIESGVIGLGKADVYKLENVYMSAAFGSLASIGDTDITSRFELDTGQRDNFYDIGRIKLKTGSLVPSGQLLVKFDYFSHGSGDYFDVDSYSGVVNYEDIPSYTSDTTSKIYQLRDCLDFRPRVDDASTINSGNADRTYDGAGASTVDVVEFNSDITADMEYYLKRIDKIFITKDGQLKALPGASDLNPLKPGNLDGHLHLATLHIPSYTLNPDEVEVEKIDNRRYTMRDIGHLERRISNVEYYTSLSLLEANAQSMQIQDADGLDRFKNGFVVDNFTGHNIGDVRNFDYKCAMDMERGEVRPMFNQDAVTLEEVDEDGTAILAADRTAANYTTTGDLISLPYTETSVIQNPYATKTENLNPFMVFDWIGTIELNPAVDEWRETERVPEVTVDLAGSFDQLAREQGLENTGDLSEIPMGTAWNEWQTNWTGNPRSWREGWTQVSQTDSIQTRGGIRTTVIPRTVTHSLGDRVVSVNFVPFIRSRDVTFEGYGLRPNTRVFPFFDNVAIASYATPDGGSLGGNLNTNANGYIKGVFAIPNPNVDSNPRWRTGKRVFRLTSSSTNSMDRTAIATSAEGDYDAKGLLNTMQGVNISTRETETVRTTVNETRQITNTSRVNMMPRGDPLAQSFMIDTADGCFITSLDAYFATKSTTIPVKAEIRNMVNGYPGNQVLPFGRKWLNPGDVNTSTDGTTATTFTFPSPVYLKEETEYCIVLYTDSQDYTAYVSRLGGIQIGSDRTVSEQPATGVLFKSANNKTWNAEQMEDLTFNLKKAVFTTGTYAMVTLANADLPVKTLKNNPIRTFNGSSDIRVYHKSHGMHSTTDNVTIAGVGSGTYNGFAHSEINGTYTSIKNITLDSYDLLVPGGPATATGDVGSNTVTATQNRQFDVLQLQLGHVIHPGTSITTGIRTTTGKSVDGAESQFALAGASSEKSITMGDNVYFTAPQMVASTINQTNEMSSLTNYKSILVNNTLYSTNANLSPVLDTQRLNAFCISNRLNQPAVTSTDTFTGDGSTVAYTLSATPSSVHLVSVKKDGKKLTPVVDFTTSGSDLTMAIAPADKSKIVAKISNKVDYEDDTAISGLSSAGAYMTRSVSLANPSTALDVRVGASVRSTSTIKFLYRLSGGEETRRLNDIPWTYFNTDGSPDTSITPSVGDTVQDDDFKEYQFSASSLPEFTSFQVKCVMNGLITSYPPRLKDLRAIALAV
jgi:hypothetical protein